MERINDILVADSNPKSTELMGDSLRQKGYKVVTASSGHQVLAKTQLFTPNLVILDISFDDISGYEVCRKIKTNPNTEYTLVLFLCSLETKDAVIRAFEAGADDIIEKNFDALVLVAKVKSLLRISELRTKLQENYAELEKKNKMLEFQLKMGQQIQHSIMKDFDLEIGGAQILTTYLPALDIGGDFYEISKFEASTGICIGDVSGHGISAALLTTMLLSMIKSETAQYRNPDLFLGTINTRFCRIFENTDIGIYACLFCSLIDTKNQTLYYSNAGQAPPFYYNSKSGEFTELETSGTPIGMMPNSTYECRVLDYNKDDVLVLYTDGLSDALYKNSPEEFHSRMSEIFEDAAQNGQPLDLNLLKKSIIEMFYNSDLVESKKYVLDDVSLILCRFD
ncbi:transcriptional regulator [Clostridia bacterium]|nr:transcriptional regulator [Clostridia bacterium]